MEVEGLIVWKDDNERLVTAPVLLPNTPDCDCNNGEDPLSEARIQKMAYDYMQNHRIVDKMHDYHLTQENVATPVASWILDSPRTVKNIKGETVTLPKGTWMATVKINDDKTWKKVQDGIYRGFSVTAMSKEIADRLASKSRILIKDLKEPVGYTISLVPEPCVHEAVFCSIKEDNSVVKAGRRISDKTKAKLEAARDAFTAANEAIGKLLNAADNERNVDTTTNKGVEEMDEKEIKEIVQTSIKEALDQYKKDEEEAKKKADEEAKKEADEAAKKKDKKEEKVEPEIPEEVQKQLDDQEKEIAALKKKLDPGSKGLTGQDGHVTKGAEKSLNEQTNRDLYGRKINKG